MYYVCKASPGQTVWPIVKDKDTWIVQGSTIVHSLAIKHDKELGVFITYLCDNGHIFQETIEEQSIVHLDKISALHACHHKNKGG